MAKQDTKAFVLTEKFNADKLQWLLDNKDSLAFREGRIIEDEVNGPYDPWADAAAKKKVIGSPTLLKEVGKRSELKGWCHF